MTARERLEAIWRELPLGIRARLIGCGLGVEPVLEALRDAEARATLLQRALEEIAHGAFTNAEPSVPFTRIAAQYEQIARAALTAAARGTETTR